MHFSRNHNDSVPPLAHHQVASLVDAQKRALIIRYF
jgi:hypothetical protein